MWKICRWNKSRYCDAKYANLTDSYKNILKSYNKKILLNELNFSAKEINELCEFIFKNNKNKNKIIYETTKYILNKINPNPAFRLKFSNSDRIDGKCLLSLLIVFNILTQEQIYKLFEYYCVRILYCHEIDKEQIFEKILNNYIINSYELSKENIIRLMSLSSLQNFCEEKIKEHYYAKNRKEILSILEDNINKKWFFFYFSA